MREITCSGPCVGNGVGVDVWVGVGVGVGDGVAVSVTVGVGDAVRVGVGVGVRVAVGVPVGVWVGAVVNVGDKPELGIWTMIWRDPQAARTPPKVVTPAKRRNARRLNVRRSGDAVIRQEHPLGRDPGDSDHFFAFAGELIQVVRTVDRFDLETSLAEEQLEFATKEVMQ